MIIYTEVTPNPATLKFVTERVFLSKGSADFPEPSTSKDSPLATSLFGLDFVKAVFIGYNFVTITKSEDKRWEEIIPGVKEALKAFLATGGPAVIREEAPEVAALPGEENVVVRQILKLLDENIRPAVAMDGGDVVFESFEDGVVKLKMQGSCSGCPSSLMTLKMGIEGLLTRMVPEVKEVVAV